jgi:hypothetical protein
MNIVPPDALMRHALRLPPDTRTPEEAEDFRRYWRP